MKINDLIYWEEEIKKSSLIKKLKIILK